MEQLAIDIENIKQQIIALKRQIVELELKQIRYQSLMNVSADAQAKVDPYLNVMISKCLINNGYGNVSGK